MLGKIIPFRYLSHEEREALRSDATETSYRPGEVLIRQGATGDRRVFLLIQGTVDVVDIDSDPEVHLRTLGAGHYFGERGALFEEERSAEVRARGPVRALSISGDRFLRLIHESTPFAQALGNILRDKQGIFAPFDRFRAELVLAVGRGSVDLARLVPLYRQLEPALHTHAASVDTFDVDALRYAVRRLPDNVTRTLAFYLTEALPPLYSDPDQRFVRVATAARRRAVYEMLPGKNMVLLRDGLTDVADLVTCLCLYAIEARKIRRAVRNGGGLEALSDELLESLRPVWPTDTRRRVVELALHHEDFRIEVHKELDNYESAHAESWAEQIAQATRDLVGTDPTDLPSDLPVHIVSSNTHSVTNCLSGWVTRNADGILAWAGDSRHPFAEETWLNRHDLVCALARDYLAAIPEARAARESVDRDGGILALDWTAFTGIGVQLVDTSRLSASALDPGIEATVPLPRSLIVNIDYAFGEQAKHIVANLISLFGRNLASVSVLGKAGGLVGSRGDVLVADGFVEQSGDQYYPLPSEPDVDLQRLARLLPARAVHRGTVLTVTGTLLQNRKMLQFNRHIWGCQGLEMEGASYLRQILESRNRRAISRDVSLRFLYYVSDLPLRHDANLSSRLRATEGVPPLYAITREVLSGILQPGAPPPQLA